jgi:hypothetical protein
MRFVAVIAVAMLLSGCTWVRQELSLPPATPPPVPTVPKPEPARPPKPKPHVERPAPEPQQSEAQTQTVPPPPIDYDARCRTLAAHRADDAKQLGASPADQAKMQSDTYRDCVAQSVK